MRKSILNISFLLFVILTVIISVWGPEALATYQDRLILGRSYELATENTDEGYLYTLSNNDKLYILSESLSSQVLPESDLSALTGSQVPDPDYQELGGSYAFVVNRRGPSGREITDDQIFETCNREIAALKELGILPDEVREVDRHSYDTLLYSAIDILEPRNSVAVWKINLSDSQSNYNRQNRVLDLYIDADSGKIYEFYVRTELKWGDLNPDEIIEKWQEYMGLRPSVPYETENPLLETTPYFKKYMFSGAGEEKTVVTIGFYEGINELFLKITN